MKKLLPLLLCACAPEAPRDVVANQEPIASLSLPADVKAGVLVELDASASVDIDGTITSMTLDFGDGSEPELHDPATSPGAVKKFAHVYGSAGLHTVQLEVVDDDGLVGRARLPLDVGPPPDATPPVIDEVIIADTMVARGSNIDVAVSASDPEGNLVAVRVNDIEAPLSGSHATTTVTVAAAETVAVIAIDAFGNQSAPISRSIVVVDADADTDGDGLFDLADPNPDVFNGLSAEIFEITEIEEDALGRQKAESVLEALTLPLASFDVAGGYLGKDAGEESVDALPFHDDAPALLHNFALRYTGTLVAPLGATHVIVEMDADDVGVVSLDGVVVASADDEYAFNFFRSDRAPATTEPIALGAETPIEIVLANGVGASAWSIRFRFLSDDDTILNPEAVSRANFLAR